MIRFSCPQCKLVLQATEQKIGTAIACPKCAKRMKVPEGPNKAKIDDPNRHTQHSFSVDQAVQGDWFYVKDKKKVGPVALDDIKQMVTSGQLQSTDVIIKTGMQKWLPIHGVLDLLPPQPAANGGKYFYVHDKQKSGPISIQELKQRLGQGKLVPTDMVLKDGTQKWLAASTLTELFPPGTPAAKPAGDASKDWFCVRNKQKSGPLPIAELRAMVGDGRLAPSDMVLKPGTQKWLAAEDIDELFGPAPVPEEVAKAATDKGPAVPERPKPAPAAAARPVSPAPATSSPAVPRPAPPPAAAPLAPSSPAVPRPAAAAPAPPRATPPAPLPAIPPSSAGGSRPASPSVQGSPKRSLPIPNVAPAPPPPMPDVSDDVEDEYFEETPIPTEAMAVVTPRDEHEIDVEPIPPPRGKKRKGKKSAGSSRPLQMLLAAWLGVVVVRTMALLLYDPQLSLFLWPIEWAAGLGVAWLSFRRRLRLGVVVGLLGPLLVLLAMGAFTGMGISKAEGLEYLRYVMVPFGVVAIILGWLVMQAARRGGKVKPAKGKKGKRKRPTSTMRLAATARKARSRVEENPDEDSEIGALGRYTSD